LQTINLKKSNHKTFLLFTTKYYFLQDIQKAMEVFSLQQRAAKTPEEALHKQYRFWYTQPVPKMSMYCLSIFFFK